MELGWYLTFTNFISLSAFQLSRFFSVVAPAASRWGMPKAERITAMLDQSETSSLCPGILRDWQVFLFVSDPISSMMVGLPCVSEDIGQAPSCSSHVQLSFRAPFSPWSST
jgi:hypothetical protein